MKKILALLVIVSVCAVGAAYMFINKIDKIEISEANVYQYLSGIKYTYSGDLQLTRKDGQTLLYNNGKKFEMNSDPIYYNEENKLLLPKNMVLVNYKTGQVQKVNHFNYILMKDHKYYANINKKDIEIKDSFLFDGADTYIFLDDVKLKYADKTYNLTPMSYATFKNNSSLYMYMKNIGEFKNENILNETVLVTSNDGYTVNLGSDSLTYNDNNQKQLLPKEIEDLVNFE